MHHLPYSRADINPEMIILLYQQRSRPEHMHTPDIQRLINQKTAWRIRIMLFKIIILNNIMKKHILLLFFMINVIVQFLNA